MRTWAAGTVRLAAWCAGLVVAARVLAVAGADSSSIPLSSPHDLAAWTAETPPAEMSVALLRLGGLAGCAYLLAVTAVGVAARALGLRRLAGAVGRVTPGVVRRIVAGGSGVGLAVGALVGALPAPDVPAGPPRSTVAAVPGASAPRQATMSRIGPGAAPGTATMTPSDAPSGPVAPPGRATMSRVGEPASSATMTRIADPAAPPSAPATPLPPPPAGNVAGPAADHGPGGPPAEAQTRPAAEPDTARDPFPATPPPALPTPDPGAWTVEPGDSLWSIADEVLREVRADATERDVTVYWQALVAANRASLIDPGNPDLLVPGQQITVPPPTR